MRARSPASSPAQTACPGGVIFSPAPWVRSFGRCSLECRRFIWAARLSGWPVADHQNPDRACDRCHSCPACRLCQPARGPPERQGRAGVARPAAIALTADRRQIRIVTLRPFPCASNAITSVLAPRGVNGMVQPQGKAQLRLAADIGGTFTDIAVFDEKNRQAYVRQGALDAGASGRRHLSPAVAKAGSDYRSAVLFLHGSDNSDQHHSGAHRRAHRAPGHRRLSRHL